MSTDLAGYVDFGFSDTSPLCCAPYVFPLVLELAHVGPGARVLDAGCGNGALSGLLAERGCQVTGVDPSKRGIAIARTAYPDARFEVLPVDERMAERLGETDFDLVVSTEVIEHLYAPAPFLGTCHEILRPGGQLVLSTPYHGYLKNVLISVTGRYDDHVQARSQGGHIKFWSRQTLTATLKEVGFERIEFRGAGRIPFLWKSMVMAGVRPA